MWWLMLSFEGELNTGFSQYLDNTPRTGAEFLCPNGQRLVWLDIGWKQESVHHLLWRNYTAYDVWCLLFCLECYILNSIVKQWKTWVCWSIWHSYASNICKSAASVFCIHLRSQMSPWWKHLLLGPTRWHQKAAAWVGLEKKKGGRLEKM